MFCYRKELNECNCEYSCVDPDEFEKWLEPQSDGSWKEVAAPKLKSNTVLSVPFSPAEFHYLQKAASVHNMGVVEYIRYTANQHATQSSESLQKEVKLKMRLSIENY